MINRFAAFGDRNPIHLDQDYARSMGLPDTVAHGALIFALASGLFMQMGLHGDSKIVFRSAESEFKKFVHPHDSIRLEIKVVEVKPLGKIQMTTIDVKVKNQLGVLVLKGTWTGITQQQ